MNAGKLDRRITFQRKTATQDTFGAATESWADYATVWAEVVPLQARELFAAQQMKADVDTRFRTRYQAGITAQDRISYDGRVYDIFQVFETGRREGLEIMGKARAD